MDCPKGYVCRVLASKEHEVPIEAKLIQSKLLPIFELTLQAKSIVQCSISLIEKAQKTKHGAPQDFAIKAPSGFKLPHPLNVGSKRKADVLQE
ncbi:predicted protein [Lichtheimia corymbifera JMRC:FSU:9682]|uniref:Uncharacterized protein n=1 Tax=Lichtheimia corymbifera JMRC:FSU:9682 TaxID=1263082 RepID=A0A068RV04_9FUNG|nr:predicted protein [Lichtheimia corymbifera JMRC:FSU:9682]